MNKIQALFDLTNQVALVTGGRNYQTLQQHKHGKLSLSNKILRLLMQQQLLCNIVLNDLVNLIF